MKVSSVCLLLLAACLVWADVELGSNKTYHGDKVFRIFLSTAEQREMIAKWQHTIDDLDFWSQLGKTSEHVDIRVPKFLVHAFTGLLNSNELAYVVTIDDVQSVIDSTNAVNEATRKRRSIDRANDISGMYATYDEIYAWAQAMCAEYSDMAECGTYGQSYEGKTLFYMKLGKVPVGKKNAVFLEAGMHAREWINHASTIYVVNRLLTTYSTDSTAKRMLDNWNIYVTFVSNPDGYIYSMATDRLWRKTRSQWGSNKKCFGVDPNRNYDVAWATTGSSSSACSDTYHGPSAFSEYETKAISDLITLHKDEILAFFAIHSYSQMWLIPYGYTTGLKPDDYNELLRVANVGGNALMAVNNKKWQIGNSADVLYACGGASDDWAKVKAEIKYSYTIELRPADTAVNGFVQPASEIEPSGREVYAGLVAAIDALVN